MNSPNLLVATASSPLSSQAWLQSSVQKFFSDFNWEDIPPEVQGVKLALPSGDALPLTLSVNQFFAAINWEDASIAAPTQKQPTELLQSDELTLEDFFSLF